MCGGLPGARGLNLLRREGKIISLGGKNTVEVVSGEVLTIFSPGGGGFGLADGSGGGTEAAQAKVSLARTSGSLNQYTLNQESV